MSVFENVTVELKANIYFDGNVTSRTVKFGDGSTKTLGIMLPGEYKFGTNKAELMEINAGSCQILLPGESSWQSIEAGSSFEVQANASFKIKAIDVVDYCCSYLQ